MSTLKSYFKLLNINGTHKRNIFIIQCNTEYPTPVEVVNLNVIKEFKKIFGNNVGYSDHTLGNQIAIVAVALGSKIIEKHFTFSRNAPGPDHLSEKS